MNILYIIHEYLPINSGGVTQALGITRELAARGHQVFILTPRLPGYPPYDSPSPNLHLYRCRSFRKTVGNATLLELIFFGLIGFFFAINICKKHKIDVGLGIFMVPSGFIAFLLKLILKIPYVVYIGGADLPNVQSKFKKFLSLIKPILRIILANSERVLVSEGLDAFLADIKPGLPATLVRGGTNVLKVQPPPRLPPGSCLRILAVGRLVERKGYLQILAALAALSSSERQAFKLTIAGYGPLQKSMEKIIHQNNLNSMVTMLGEVPQVKVKDLYQDADVFIFYSSPEGTPQSMVEAMAYELPVITSNVPGNRELVDGNGIVAEFDNLPSLLQAFRQLPNLKKDLITMGKKSREIAKQYDWSTIVNVYEKQLQQAIRD